MYKAVRTEIIKEQNSSRIVLYGHNCSVWTVLTYGKFSTERSLLNRTETIKRYGRNRTVPTILYLTDNIVPYRQYCTFRTKLVLSDSTVPICFRNESIVPFGPYLNSTESFLHYGPY